MRLTFLAGILAIAGCGGEGKPGVEEQIRRELGKQLGVPVAKVRCPEGAYPRTCAAELPGATVDVALAETGEWSLAGFVIATAPLEVAIEVELDELGVEAEVDCAPAYRVVQVGERVACVIDASGVEGAAWARITDEDARFDLELALDPAAVAARTGEVDEAELERLSRALDDGEPFAGEDEGALVDAGAP
jgi:hypothetical protein